jgi:hypothetical protein
MEFTETKHYKKVYNFLQSIGINPEFERNEDVHRIEYLSFWSKCGARQFCDSAGEGGFFPINIRSLKFHLFREFLEFAFYEKLNVLYMVCSVTYDVDIVHIKSKMCIPDICDFYFQFEEKKEV